MDSKNHVIVIGAGFSGLSAASNLSKLGYRVTILEKNEMAGGRARKFEQDGFVFDMGPSWYWMPDVFEQYFEVFDKKPSDYYDLIRLDPSYKVVFEGFEDWDIPANFDEACALFESIEDGAGQQLVAFMEEAKYKYEVGIKDLVFKPGRSLLEFASLQLLIDVFKIKIFKSMSKHVRDYFKHPKLIQLMEFPVLFLGATPENTPSLYSLMNYADTKLGTWYPDGGMHKIVEGMVKLAIEQGAIIKLNTGVQSFQYDDNNITGVVTDQGEVIHADIVVGAADYHHLETKVVAPQFRQYSESYWDSRVLAPSSLLFYLGLDTKINKLPHHTLFFDRDFGPHAIEIYEDKKWPSDPLFYACVPSKTDSSVAPNGKENLFLLVPVATDLKDEEAVREKYYHMIMDRLETFTGQSLKDKVIFKRSFAHNDFKSDYNSFKGNAYGLANTLKQTAILKPRMKSNKLKNLYYTGQLTVPGPGVPPSLISGQVVASEIAKDFKLNFNKELKTV